MSSKSKSALAQLKLSRAGQKRTDQYKVDKDTRIYDEVEEGVYRKVVANRMLQDDFVEDDGPHGYADNGEEDWDRGGNDDDERMEIDSEEEEREARRRAKQSKAASSSKGKKPSKPKPKSKASSEGEDDDDAPAVSIDAYRKPIAPEKEHDFLNSILNDLDTKAVAPNPASSNSRRNGAAHNTKSVARKRKPSMSDSSDGYGPDFNNPRDPNGFGVSSDAGLQSSPLKPSKKAKIEETDIKLGDATSSDGDFDAILTDEDDAAFADLDFNDLQFEEVKPQTIVKQEPTKQTEKPQVVKEEPVDDKPFVQQQSKAKPPVTTDRDVKNLDLEVPSWLKINDVSNAKVKGGDEEGLGPLNSSTNGAVSSSTVNALEEDGSLRFYWLDYLELDGKLYFVGKVLDRGVDGKKRNWVSCCVTVDGIERNLFVRPREFRLDKKGAETDEEVDQDDVYTDFDAVRKSCRVKSWAGKWVKRKYVFDDVEEGMDPEQDYLKVVYSFGEPMIPEEAYEGSPNIEKIYGTKTSAFELFVLKRKIMGPCWLNIEKPKISTKGVSWCKLEVEVDDPKTVSPFSESDDKAPRDIPPLTVMSISVRTIVNHQTNQREIVSAALRFWKDMNIEDPTPPEKQESSAHIVVRCLDKYPAHFEETARRQSPVINAVKNEKTLLSSLLTVIKTRDPDIIVGHEFLGVYLDVILLRLKQQKVEPWSCIGRFRRSKWPVIGRQGTNIRFLQGRLLCDLGSDAAKSMITSTTWSLTEMCSAHLNFNRQEIDPEDTAMYFDSTVGSPDRLLGFVRHCEVDAFLQMALSSKVQMLPLTKQLTTLAGNSWNKTLNGGRAERNEYILLHEFHRLKYICPDKSWKKKAPAANVKAEVKEEAEEGEHQPDGAPAAAKPKRDKYKGGLVFDPKRGLWDTYILVMDFNSLYPSIIQEFNIDFTTVLKAEIYEGDEEKIPDVPDGDVPQGVLPRLIATLVNRRRQVKNLMKDPKATASQLMQWDIKQKALKLTANSMYGCLGFEGSRFYARPLAALTTSKGREILMNTKTLAEDDLQLDVVYGDTDSVFVDSKAETLADALKVANNFKKKVNERYKLLEIDLDAVFQRVLLLQKKKYAAVKVETSGQTSLEIKGLDMKRREYCALSKNVSKQVLDYILSGQPTDVVLEQIHEYLRTIGDDVRSGKVGLEDMTIFKRLGKNPEEYDPKGQPHVQVALRMKARGGSAKAGDVIPYLFCQGEHGESSKTGQADRAMHPDEVRRGEDIKIDFEYYLSQQVLPPVERLCDPIEGTDRARIAECLGLDASKFQVAPTAGAPEREFVSFASLLSDKERFRDAEPLLIECKECHGTFEFTSMRFGKLPPLTPAGLACASGSCSAVQSKFRIQASLQVQIRKYIGRYYEGWSICDEETCQNRTRQVGMHSKHCARPGCTGNVRVEYSDSQVYNQLLYFRSLFDGTKALETVHGSAQGDIAAFTHINQEFLNSTVRLIEGYINQCGRGWVELSTLFAAL